MGGIDSYGPGGDYYKFYDRILSFDISSQSWIKVGQMLEKRRSHAMSVVDAQDVMYYCVDKDDCHPDTEDVDCNGNGISGTCDPGANEYTQCYYCDDTTEFYNKCKPGQKKGTFQT